MATVLRRGLEHNTDVRTEVEQAVDRLMTDQQAPMPMWLDVDAVTTRYCAEQHLDVPTDPSKKMDIHMRAIEVWIEAVNSEPRRAP